METTYYAQPYDIIATGFYFTDQESYTAKILAARNSYGDPVEEFEIQFIDGTDLDAKLAKALGLYQNTIIEFMEKVEAWDDHEKLKIILAVGECRYSFDLNSGDPDNLDLDIYAGMNLRDLAHEFVEEGLFGDILPSIINYLDYDAIARDLGMDYTETTICGERYVYRCG